MRCLRSALVLAAAVGGVGFAAVCGVGFKPPRPSDAPPASAPPASTPPASAPVAQPAPAAPAASPEQQRKPGPVLRGRITDESGRPVKGVKVQLYSGVATRREGQSMVTGDDGVYAFDPLETGSLTRPEGLDRWDYYVGVRIEHDSLVPADGEPWFDLTVPSVDRQVTVRDIVMSRGGTMSGEIRMEDGFAWPELELRFMPVSGKGTHWYATTDRKGRFETRALVPGEYSVQWNSPQADYPELAKVSIEPGRQTTVKVTAAIKVEAHADIEVK